MANLYTSSFTRPNDTTAYASGDLVANSTTAASVVPLSWTFNYVYHGNLIIRRFRLTKSTTTIANASFRLHIYLSSPTGIANGDNGAWSTNISNHIGYIDSSNAIAFVNGTSQTGATMDSGSEIILPINQNDTVYGLLEARAAYTPGAQEVFTVNLDIYLQSD
jgi:hypothetical protein